MTIPEFAKAVKSNNNSKISAVLGDCYDANVILYEMISPYLNHEDLRICIDTTLVSTGIIKYRINSNSETMDFSEVQNRYNDMNIDQFNKSFVSNTKVTKNNTLIITLTEKKNSL